MINSDRAVSGTGHGTWIKLGDRRFAYSWKKNWFSPSGQLLYIFTVRSVLELGDGFDTFEGESEAEFTFLDSSPPHLIPFIPFSGQRMEVELPSFVEVEMPDSGRVPPDRFGRGR